jgi:hydrogenase expression/formation protein HypE
MANNTIRALFFDFDGTLTSPGALDFPKIKLAIDCPAEIPILEFIDSLNSQKAKTSARKILDTFEIEAAASSHPNSGCESLIRHLKDRRLKIGIISRNSLKSIEKALENFNATRIDDFDIIISRDSPVAVKPAPDGIQLAAENLGIPTSRVMMVGDYIFDLQAGRAAGTHTVLIDSGGNHSDWAGEYDFSIESLDELKKIISLGEPLPAGKIPNTALGEFIDEIKFKDPSILIGPGVGEDTAAIDITGEQVLALKSDPITFVTNDAGYYAVIINANDIATSGAIPRWLLTTLLFPPGATALQIRKTMLEIRDVCKNLGIILCGGHTEITDAVTRPVVTGMMAGTVTRSKLLDKGNMLPGDKILLTKRVAVEGTAILAGEFKKQLTGLGIGRETILEGEGFLSMISILPEAELASEHSGTVAMHDVTEGGLATALFELSSAAGYRIRIEMDQIPVFDHTRKLCAALGLNPLGLIGSGSLLIACRPEHHREIMRRIQNEKIEVSCIGEVVEKGRGIEALKDGRKTKWPEFEVDELARLFQEGL